MTVSNYHLSLLITGGTPDKRYTRTQDLAEEYSIHSSDRIELIGTSTIGIEHVRQWVKRLSYKPISSQQKIGIIHPGELLSIEAQQSLLKTIEEPPAQTIIAITVPFMGALLSTIQSRCIELSIAKKDETIVINDTLIEVLHSGESKRLELAAQYGSADQADTYIKNLRLALQQALTSQSKNTDFDLSTLIPIYTYIEEAEHALKVNVHPRLVIENLLLSLPTLK